MTNTIVVCDLETTGLDQVNDKIIEVGLVRLENGKMTGKFHSLVNPGFPLPLKIKRLTGLDDVDLIDAPALSQVMPEIIDFIGDSVIGGHNVRFDIGFLEAARGLPVRNRFYDTLELAKIIKPDASSFRLEALCSVYQIEARGSHRALDDAMATAQLLTTLIQNLGNIELDLLVKLTSLLLEAKSEWYTFFNDFTKEKLKIFPDKKIKKRLYWNSREDEDDKYSLTYRENGGASEKIILDEDDVAAIVRKEGPLAACLPVFEYRPQQEAMVRQVTRALNEEKYLLMEAGTGVGKSMAYLVPALAWGLLNKKRILVATHTINLQEQLWFKDIPLLAKITNQPFQAALAKGRQNYICLHRWLGALNSPHQPEEAAFYARVLVWLSMTKTGDKSELNMAPGEGDFWFDISGEAEGCIGSRCQYQRDCFVHRARKAAENADLIITNHSLLFSDIRSENRVLPTYGPLIIDEAHHLEDSATAHLGKQFLQSALHRWLGVSGKALAKLMEKATPVDGLKWIRIIQAALGTRLEAFESARLFFQTVWDMAAKNISKGAGEYSRTSIRLPCSEEGYDEFLVAGGKCVELLRSLNGEIRSAIEMMDIWAISEEAWAGHSRNLAQIFQTGQGLIDDLAFILENQGHGYVYWAELESTGRGTNRHCSLMAAPIDIGTLLYECFFKNKNTVVFTSATLSVSGKFDHFIMRNGLDNLETEQLLQKHYDSPFLYDQQALLCINRELPVQGTVKDDYYMERLEESILKILEVTKGRTLVLFTSHRTLREVYKRLKPRLEVMDICLLGHGLDGSRSRLLEEFKTTERTVLFGSSSFWEGVDVPGNALSCVIIVKLPFMPPSVPVIEARLEELARQHKDGFRVLSVPHAVIRFKQGFGRLIRSGSDHGCVVILDGRILSKSYGRQFLNSLPVKSHIRGEIEMISRKISEWLKYQQGNQNKSLSIPGRD